MNQDDAQLTRLLDELAQALKLPTARSEPHVMAIRFDDRIDVTLRRPPDDVAHLLLLSDLGPVKPDLTVYENLLRGNLLWHSTGGATLSLSDETPRHVVIAEKRPLQSLSCKDLESALEAFTNVAQAWAHLLTLKEESDENSSLVPPLTGFSSWLRA